MAIEHRKQKGINSPRRRDLSREIESPRINRRETEKMEEKREGKNGITMKKEFVSQGERCEVGCPIRGSLAIMENRGRRLRIRGTSGAKRKREREKQRSPLRSALDWRSMTRLAIGPFKEDSIRRLDGDGQTDRLLELVVVKWCVLEYLMKRLRFTKSTRESGFNRNPSRSSYKSRRGRDLTVCPLNEE